MGNRSGSLSRGNGLCLSLSLDTENTREQSFFRLSTLPKAQILTRIIHLHRAIACRHLEIRGIARELVADLGKGTVFLYIVLQYTILIVQVFKRGLPLLPYIGEPIDLGLLIDIKQRKQRHRKYYGEEFSQSHLTFWATPRSKG